jgi:hypothetical protein
LFEALPENPQTLGDLVGRGIRIFRSRAGFLFSILLWPSILTCAGMTMCRLVFGHWVNLHTMSVPIFVLHASFVFAGICIFAYAQWELMLRGLAILRLTVGNCDDYAEAYKYSKKRWLAAALIYSLTVLLPLLVLLFWSIVTAGAVYVGRQYHLFPYITILPFAMIGLSSTITLSWSFLVGSMMLCVLACEDIPVMQVMKRGEELSLSHLWRGGSFVCLLAIVLLLISLAIDMPLIVISVFDMSAANGSGQPQAVAFQLPLYLEVITAVWEGLLNIVVFSIALIADGLYYRDVRLRLDGLDITARLGRIASGR